jgi:hypothetical protein
MAMVISWAVLVGKFLFSHYKYAYAGLFNTSKIQVIHVSEILPRHNCPLPWRRPSGTDAGLRLPAGLFILQPASCVSSSLVLVRNRLRHAREQR